MSQMPGTPLLRNVCPHCQRTFIRSEHLRRHIHSVHDERGTIFRCGDCGKTFNRADSCRRHELSHLKENEPVIAMARSGERVRRACRNCAKARTKCSGGDSCSRCQTRNLTCTYAQRTGRQRMGQTRRSPRDRESSLGPEHEGEHYATSIATALPRQTTLESDAQTLEIPVVANPELPTHTNTAELAAHGFEETFNWSDSINWLPVADNVDFSLLFGAGLESGVQENWQPVTPNTSQPSRYNEHDSSDSSDDDKSTAENALSLYADGRGGRRSLLTVPKSPRSSHVDDDDTLAPILEFPIRTMSPLTTQLNGSVLDSKTHEVLLEHFQLLCTGRFSYGKAFRSAAFPTLEHLSHFLGLYIRHFHSDLPLVHRSTWSERTAPWILVLAVATIGAGYDHGPDCFQTMAALREFLRRAVRWHLEVQTDCDPLPLAQASLLHAISQLGNTSGTSASASRHDLELAMESYEANVVLFSPDQIDLSQALLKWQAWIAQESHIRLIWTAWLVQAISTWTSSQKRHVALPDQRLTLPCETALWNASSLDAWITCLSTTRSSGNLASALQSLFVRHLIPSPLDNFGEVLLTYAILARTNEVAQATQQPLHAWSPAPGVDLGTDEDDSIAPENGPIWLPANPRFAAWRNSACDSLDVLHWRANGNVAMNHGSEAPLILHLHLSRLLLLCPYREFLDLASQLKRRPQTTYRELPTAAQLDESILRWLTMDDHKGRLSLVHAGALFWHLRRYARGHFYEPFSVYLATLTIWVYGVYLPQVRGNLIRIKEMNAADRSQRLHETGQSKPSESSSEDEDDLTPKNILLDRPCDDEMVQTFVRRGHTMQADMSGARDICLSSSQKAILQEGIKLLRRSQYKTSGQSQMYRSTLQRMLQFG